MMDGVYKFVPDTNLFKEEGTIGCSATAQGVTDEKRSVELWHRRFGYIYYRGYIGLNLLVLGELV
jgi:hypothetical protein